MSGRSRIIMLIWQCFGWPTANLFMKERMFTALSGSSCGRPTLASWFEREKLSSLGLSAAMVFTFQNAQTLLPPGRMVQIGMCVDWCNGRARFGAPCGPSLTFCRGCMQGLHCVHLSGFCAAIVACRGCFDQGPAVSEPLPVTSCLSGTSRSSLGPTL